MKQVRYTTLLRAFAAYGGSYAVVVLAFLFSVRNTAHDMGMAVVERENITNMLDYQPVFDMFYAQAGYGGGLMFAVAFVLYMGLQRAASYDRANVLISKCASHIALFTSIQAVYLPIFVRNIAWFIDSRTPEILGYDFAIGELITEPFFLFYGALIMLFTALVIIALVKSKVPFSDGLRTFALSIGGLVVLTLIGCGAIFSYGWNW